MTRALRGGLVWVAALALGATCVSAADLDKLRWLEGTWEQEMEHGTVYEKWRAVSDRTFEGESWFVDHAGNKSVTEWLRVVEMGGEVFYVPRPKQNPMPVAFPLVGLTADKVVFENPDHDFPQRITYERHPDGSVTATVESPAEDGRDARRIVLKFTRAD